MNSGCHFDSDFDTDVPVVSKTAGAVAGRIFTQVDGAGSFSVWIPQSSGQSEMDREIRRSSLLLILNLSRYSALFRVGEAGVL